MYINTTSNTMNIHFRAMLEFNEMLKNRKWEVCQFLTHQRKN